MITLYVRHNNQQYPVKFDDDATVDGEPIRNARLILAREDGIMKCRIYFGGGKTLSLSRRMFGRTTVPVNGDYLDLRKENQKPITGKRGIVRG